MKAKELKPIELEENENFEAPAWVPDPWNYGLNLITMRRPGKNLE